MAENAPGIVDGVMTDPEAWFRWRSSRENPSDMEGSMRRMAQDFYNYGWGHQCSSGCAPRGRVFLPWREARDCRPNLEDPLERCLGVKQEKRCWEKAVDVHNQDPPSWVWVDRAPGIAYVPLEKEAPPVPSGDFVVLIHDYDRTAQRSNPNGHLVRYEVVSDLPVVKLELKLIEDNEPPVYVMFSDQSQQDGRYIRGVAWKPVRNGTFNLRLRAWDSADRLYESQGEYPVTVVE
jgi:hypothetical protein